MSAYTDHRQPFVVMNRLTVIHQQMRCSLLPPLSYLDYRHLVQGFLFTQGGYTHYKIETPPQDLEYSRIPNTISRCIFITRAIHYFNICQRLFLK